MVKRLISIIYFYSLSMVNLSKVCLHPTFVFLQFLAFITLELRGFFKNFGGKQLIYSNEA